MSSYRPVQSVTRALRLLTELNALGHGTIAELHRRTSLPKPTIVRLLDTLASAGFVSRDVRHGGYQVTSRVDDLSRGFHGVPLVIEAARPIALELTRKLKWPVAIAILDHDAMVVRFSSIIDSPMSPFYFTLNNRLGLVSRAMGRAYLANCPLTERRELLMRLDRSRDPQDRPPNRSRIVRSFIRSFDVRGFSERDPDVEPRSSQTLAAPIMLGTEVRATIGLSYFRSAVPRARAGTELGQPLIEAARQIEKRLARLAKDRAASTSKVRSSVRSGGAVSR